MREIGWQSDIRVGRESRVQMKRLSFGHREGQLFTNTGGKDIKINGFIVNS